MYFNMLIDISKDILIYYELRGNTGGFRPWGDVQGLVTDKGISPLGGQ